MRNTVALIIIFICFSHVCSAQKDSSIIYFNKEAKETTKDSAYTYAVFTKNNDLWHGKVFYSKSLSLQSEGDYAEMNYQTPVGTFQNYKEDGTLDNTSSYSNGKLTEQTGYYKNGNKRSYIAFNANGITAENGWDENGKEIPGYIVQREARFKGGAAAWQRYLEKHLNSNVAVEAGAPAGDYTVEVAFLANKEGYISNVKATTIPPKCKACAAEAVSVIMNGPQWEPAIQYNEPVAYRQRQRITFQVTEDTKKKSKN